ncbi:MAG TPA: cbb3-type cytochrome c oxidase subunit I, partial [Bacteroidales bacterium]|nr:cbb3-type cytochrome c oxidase subunit I [Bacteroidales bacterium]
IGVGKIWLIVGGIFSMLEPLAFLAMALFAVGMYRKGEKKHPNKLALYWTLGTAILSFTGAGLLGMAHTLPQVNMYTHGTLVTAMHGHLAFWGAYGMIVFSFITFAMPNLTGRRLYDTVIGQLAYWLANIGMLAMTAAFGVAGVAQVYLERKSGMAFGAVQQEIEVHFFVLVLAASMFATGVILFVYEFFRFGRPSDEAIGQEERLA